MGLIAVYSIYERQMGKMPFRHLCVSSSLMVETMSWVSCLTYPILAFYIPFSIAFLGRVPLGATPQQSLSWGLIIILLILPPAIISDQMIKMHKFMNPNSISNTWNMNLIFWRSLQYDFSSTYAIIISFCQGSLAAFQARFLDADTTIWNTNRLSNAKNHQHLLKFRKTSSVLSTEYWSALFQLYGSYTRDCCTSLSSPIHGIGYYAMTVVAFNAICFVASVGVTNTDDFNTSIATLCVCAFNIFVCIEMVLLIAPNLTLVIPVPMRMDYSLSVLSIFILITLLLDNKLAGLDYTSFF